MVYENEDEFDLSEMVGKFRSEENTNVLGKFKPEIGSNVITEFVALSPNPIVIDIAKRNILFSKKAKGASLAISDKTMELADYKRVLDSHQI